MQRIEGRDLRPSIGKGKIEFNSLDQRRIIAAFKAKRLIPIIENLSGIERIGKDRLRDRARGDSAI